jgi:2-polyprenyl-3-methyl-5-hydroxy-6-metoxy-1,4-benzoquinol methylase
LRNSIRHAWQAPVAFPETADIETSSDDYAKRFAGEVGAWFLKLQEQATLRLLASHPKAAVLDVGGGHGQVTGALVAHGYSLTVFGSSEACSQRIQKYVRLGLCNFQVGNIVDLPYPDEAFDVVISYRLLPHVSRWQRLLEELTRVAREVVLVDFPAVRSVNSIAPLLFNYKKRIERNTRTFTCFRESELLGVFESLGFQRAGRYGEFFFPMVMHRMLGKASVSSALEKGSRLLGLNALLGSPVILKMQRQG